MHASIHPRAVAVVAHLLVMFRSNYPFSSLPYDARIYVVLWNELQIPAVLLSVSPEAARGVGSTETRLLGGTRLQPDFVWRRRIKSLNQKT